MVSLWWSESTTKIFFIRASLNMRLTATLQASKYLLKSEFQYYERIKWWYLQSEERSEDAKYEH